MGVNITIIHVRSNIRANFVYQIHSALFNSIEGQQFHIYPKIKTKLFNIDFELISCIPSDALLAISVSLLVEYNLRNMSKNYIMLTINIVTIETIPCIMKASHRLILQAYTP